MSRRLSSEAGFTLPELLIASGITIVVTGGMFALLNPSSGIFRGQPEVADLQQRLRSGIDAMRTDLLMAGAGVYAGTQAGALVNYFAPVLPYRQGANAALDDGPGVFKSDAISLFYVPQTSAQTTIASDMLQSSADLKVNWEPGCPSDDRLCGFEPGMGVVVFDDSSAFDTMTITAVQIDQGRGDLWLQHRQQGALSKSFRAGAKIAQIVTSVYYYNQSTNQLMSYDGSAAGVGVPVIDNVVGLTFEYYGEPTPPQMRRPGEDLTVTYGPQPSAPTTANCTLQYLDGLSLVPALAVLGPPEGGLVQLSAAQLTDGPWCPDASSANRFDADLLRIRRIRVTLRVQAADVAVRGGSSGDASSPFANPGTSRGGYAYVPDQTIRFDVSPRNLNLAR